jgi:SET domain-containing protein
MASQSAVPTFTHPCASNGVGALAYLRNQGIHKPAARHRLLRARTSIPFEFECPHGSCLTQRRKATSTEIPDSMPKTKSKALSKTHTKTPAKTSKSSRKSYKSLPRSRSTKALPSDPPLRIGRSKSGLGLFALAPIKKGKIIAEYWGKRLPSEKADELDNKYLFEVNSKWTIDGSDRRNMARYINHGCKPNAESDIIKGQVFIRSRRKIAEGDEITYDYGKNYFETFIEPYGCRCLGCKTKKKAKSAKAKADKAKADKAGKSKKAGSKTKGSKSKSTRAGSKAPRTGAAR